MKTLSFFSALMFCLSVITYANPPATETTEPADQNLGQPVKRDIPEDKNQLLNDIFNITNSQNSEEPKGHEVASDFPALPVVPAPFQKQQDNQPLERALKTVFGHIDISGLLEDLEIDPTTDTPFKDLAQHIIENADDPIRTELTGLNLRTAFEYQGVPEKIVICDVKKLTNEDERMAKKKANIEKLMAELAENFEIYLPRRITKKNLQTQIEETPLSRLTRDQYGDAYVITMHRLLLAIKRSQLKTFNKKSMKYINPKTEYLYNSESVLEKFRKLLTK